MINDSLVDAGDLPIAIRDFGGDHPPLVLLHGAGTNLASLTGLARALRPAHRVITMDLRGHGRSGDGPWSWDAALGDLAAVIVHLELDRPAVAGHSLGGLIATLWGRRHPETRGVVNLDGNPPPTTLDHAPGADPADLDRLQRTFDAMQAVAGRTFPTPELPALVEEQREAARAAGANEKLWVEAFRRNVVTSVADGTTTIRPDAATSGAVRTLLSSLDLGPVYETTPAPTLTVLATRPTPSQESFAGLFAAYHGFLLKQAAAAAAANPNVRYLSLEGTDHDLAIRQPELVSRVITDFLG